MKEISVKELKKMHDDGDHFQLLDVREHDEYQTANIGGELIPMGEIAQHTDKIKTDVPVVVMCRSGKRSGVIVDMLEKMDFDNVYNLSGGILAWSDEIDPSITKY